MIAFWPNDISYSHLILCIENSRNSGGTNPSVQRVNVNTGAVETILNGMTRCDPVRRTAWGTIIVGEETTDGRVYEILNPLTTTGHWIAGRATGDIRVAINGSAKSTTVVQRDALPVAADEGIGVLPTGVVYAGDELRPGTGAPDRDGGAIFRFVPTNPRVSPGNITALTQSPLASGSVYALTVSCVEGQAGAFRSMVRAAKWATARGLKSMQPRPGQTLTRVGQPDTTARKTDT